MASAIMDLRNFGNVNTNTMTTAEWLGLNSGNAVLQLGSDTLIKNIKDHNAGIGRADADIAFLIVPEGAGGQGHMTALFQDEYGFWYSFDQGTTDVNASMASLVSNSALGAGINREFDGNYNEENLKSNPNVVYIKTTREQDIMIDQAAIQNELHPKPYRLITNNCLDAIQDIFSAGKVELPLDIWPSPNSYFKKLKKMYPDNYTNSSEKVFLENSKRDRFKDLKWRNYSK
jgi:hypothetical protein